MSGSARDKLRRHWRQALPPAPRVATSRDETTWIPRRFEPWQERSSEDGDTAKEEAPPNLAGDPAPGNETGRLGAPPPPSNEERFDGWSIYTTRFPGDFVHGGWSMFEVQRRSGKELEELADLPGAPEFCWEGTAFLDTETTSLSAGAGVFVFLTGIGEFRDQELVVRQFLFRDPRVEEACLSRVVDELQRLPRWATFFGKAFDEHRLVDRARFLGLEFPRPRDHFDLYWMSRRLFHGRYRNLKLNMLERKVLGFERHDDLPGSAAPEAFFQVLRGEGEAGLEGVLRHNLWDIVSLTSLAAELSLRVERPTDVRERQAVAKAYARSKKWPRAIEWLETVDGSRRHVEDWLELSVWYRRLGQPERQGEVLRDAVAANPRSVDALIELAKWEEHRGRRPDRALDLCEQAREIAAMPISGALRQRMARLQRKLGVSG